MSATTAGAAGGSRRSIVILGADAFLAALPATPTQLSNACFAAGFDDVIPASWGDELIAVACLDLLAERGAQPAIACICPLVREQLRGASGVADTAVRLVSPPVATALYVRAVSGGDVPRITYVGDCPGAGDPSIDVHLSPQQFLSRLEERGVDLSVQPPVVAGRAPRDRRRHYSLPGGIPAPSWLATEGIGRTLVDLGEISAATREMRDALVDLGPRLGCVCSGALAGCAAGQARAAVTAIEPPRSREEIVDHTLVLPIAGDGSASLGPRGARGADVSWPAFVEALSGVWSGGAVAAVPATTGAPRLPVTRNTVPTRLARAGRVLPRAYGAHRARAGGAVRSGRATPRARPDAKPASPAGPAREPTHALMERPAIAHVPVASRVESGLAATDRVFLAGLVLAGSVIVATLTSVLTARGVREGLIARAPAARETVYVASAPAPARATVPADPPAAPPAADTRPRADSSYAPHTEIVSERRSPSGAGVASAAHVKPRARTREAAEETHAERRAPAPLPAASAPPSAPSSSATTAPPAPAPAGADSTARQNASVLEELRAIHAEIEERKRHVDSLSKALDSLKKVDSP